MTTPTNRPVALILLDGWGCSEPSQANALSRAFTPNYDEIAANFPSTKLAASGQYVGLAEGLPGNAEIGHVNIGAGRIVKTDASRIADAIDEGSFFRNEELIGAFANAVENGKAVHFIGLLSDGGVHSSSSTLYALLRMAKQCGVSQAFVHPILDGRDVPNRTADIYVEALEIKMADIGIGKIATMCGRFFGMDSGENWERTARAFTMLIHSEGERLSDAVSAVRSSFLRGISDEFIAPIVIEESPGVPVARIQDGDTVIFFNHRGDTSRQLVRSVAIPEAGSIPSSMKPKIRTVCITEFDQNFALPVAFPREECSGNLAEVLGVNGVNNYRISEADRFPHVTRIFNCGSQIAGPNELYLQASSSPRSVDRESEPEMRSFKIADSFIRHLEKDRSAVFIVNIPAPGLVAETGNLDRTVEAVQYADTCLGGMIEAMKEAHGITIVTSTHGNCESMLSPLGETDRFATGNMVPFHLIGTDERPDVLRSNGSLSDIAPTLLGILGIAKPAEMTGRDLREA